MMSSNFSKKRFFLLFCSVQSPKSINLKSGAEAFKNQVLPCIVVVSAGLKFSPGFDDGVGTLVATTLLLKFSKSVILLIVLIEIYLYDPITELARSD